jgi:hypothetical protein
VDLPGDGTDNSVIGDTINTDPSALVNFNFAQLTWPTADWTFTGQVVVSGATGPEAFPFSFIGIPEPATSGLAAFAVLVVAAYRRRLASSVNAATFCRFALGLDSSIRVIIADRCNMKFRNLGMATLIATLSSSIAHGATVVVDYLTMRAPTLAEINAEVDPVPADSQVVNFYLTSDADILAINFVDARQGGPLYNHSLGTNSSRPSNALVATAPSLGADSWIRLAPTGTAAILAVDLPGDGTVNSTWFDTVNTPASRLVNFNFAQLTWPPGAHWEFFGQVVVAGATGPEIFPFGFPGPVQIPPPRPWPEPTSTGLAAFAVIGVAAASRRIALPNGPRRPVHGNLAQAHAFERRLTAEQE